MSDEKGLVSPKKEMTLYMPSTEELGKLSSAEKEFSMVPKYRTEEDWQKLAGVPIRAFYLGTKGVPNAHGELVSCAVFATETEVFLAGQMVLVDAVSRLIDGTMVEITFIEKKKNLSTDGSTNIFEVIKLKK